MKRSEMIKIIEDGLEDNHAFAKDILNAIENSNFDKLDNKELRELERYLLGEI